MSHQTPTAFNCKCSQCRAYKRDFVKKYRAKKRMESLLSRGHCPACTMLLLPEYEKYHKGCSFYGFFVKKEDLAKN